MSRSRLGRIGRPFPLREVVAQLLSWYGAGHRALPWRETADPYAVWLSEVMLQQTRVETVIPYFHSFLRRYPDVRALAAAPLEEVLKSWEGLGYYRRARNLHAAAVRIASLGEWPTTARELAALPGVGRSTAGAIASIAFGLPSPILDGNVRRVWCRLRAQESPKPSALWTLSQEAVLWGPPGDVNQALMELGATACTPKAPECPRCPLQSMCAGFASGRPASFPAPAPRKRLPVYDVSVAFLWRRGAFLVTQRPPEGLLGGLWELPGGKWEDGEDGQTALLRELKEELGISARVLGAHPVVRHAYSHFAVRLHAFDCEPAGGRPPRSEHPARWISPSQISSLPFPRGTQKIFASAFKEGGLAVAAEAPGSYAEGSGEP